MGRNSFHGRALLVLGAALWTGEVAAAQSLIFRVGGTAAGERQGTAGAIVGDLNGDGRDEFAVGATGGASNFGLVRMYSGADASVLWAIQGPNSGSSFGASLAALGDINGDGRGDLAIGAPLANAPGVVGCGLVRVVSGATGATLFQFRGDASADHMGWSVGSAGDIDLDGVPDIIGGAIDDDDLGSSSGSARVWSGATGLALHTFFGGAPSELFGTSVDGGADVDGDGTSDLVVGGAYFVTAAQGGVVRVLSGRTFATLWSTAIAPPRDSLGSSVAFVGDVDGDGRSDVLAGARQPFTGGVGYARLYSGANGTLVWHIGAGPLERAFGSSVTATGDLDFDNVPDFAIGAPDSSTGGALSGVVRLFSGATAAVLAQHVGLPSSHLGTSVCGVGDINHDAGQDLVVGAPTESAGGSTPGAAYALRGLDVPPPDMDGDGTPDAFDGCPSDPNKIAPGLCGCGVADTDSDGDGTPNCHDGCPFDAGKLAPGICGCGIADTDSDGDGTPDCIDGCPSDPNKQARGACGCGVADTDTDGDGTADCNDGCPLDPSKLAPGVCGCGIADTDTDGDGAPDCHDGCPLDPNKFAAGLCGCGVAETDSDGDGAPDCIDGCPNDANKLAPGSCGCGVADTDSDGDGSPDCHDGCPLDPSKQAPGQCGCGVADTDSDGDGTADCHDGCPFDAAKLAPGICGCGFSDTDRDGDGTPDCNDGCPLDPSKQGPGQCGCGVADTDSDGDGTPNCIDGCPNDPFKLAPGVCGCGVADTDSDGDGRLDCNDGCPHDPNKVAPGVCGCGVADTDSDGDGTPDCHDGCPLNPALTTPGACGCDGGSEGDLDHDGTPDCLDGCPQDPLKVLPGACGCGQPDVDANGNGVFDCLEGLSSLEGDVHALVYGSSTAQHLTLRAGASHAGRRFIMMGSLSGTEPGFTLQGVHVPLVIDHYTSVNLQPQYPSAIVPVVGLLDCHGEAHVEIRVNKLDGRGFWVGRTLNHAYIVLDERCRVTFASNAVAVTILP